jgi:DDE superfamily endonuclease
MKLDEQMSTFTAHVVRELPEHIQKARVAWAEPKKSDKPNPLWKRMAWSDEFHFHVGLQSNRRIKRRIGKKERYRLDCRIEKKITKPTREAQENKLPNVHVFAIVAAGGYRRLIPYKTGNSNGKMTTAVYKRILDEIAPELKERNLILFEDCDSAHTSKGSIIHKKKLGLEYLINAPKSPDLSVIESLAARIEDKLYRRRTTTTESTEKRLFKIFFDDEIIKQEWIDEWAELYHIRLYECVKYGGRDTRY